MARLIDADKLKQHYSWWNDVTKELFDEIVDLQPTAEMVKHGRWIYYGDETIEDGGRCSVCLCDQPMFWEKKTWRYVETDYCPNCGAQMDGETP